MFNKCCWCEKDLEINNLNHFCNDDCRQDFDNWLNGLAIALDQKLFKAPPAPIQFNILDDSV